MLRIRGRKNSINVQSREASRMHVKVPFDDLKAGLSFWQFKGAAHERIWI
jgi:hypothetical protein